MGLIFGRKKLVDPIAQYENVAGNKCTLAPKISVWDKWLNEHGIEVGQEQSKVTVALGRLNGTEKGLEEIAKKVDGDRAILESLQNKAEAINDSSTPIVDPDPRDTIALHEAALAKFQTENKNSLQIVIETLNEEIESMTGNQENIEEEREDVITKLNRLGRVKKTLDKESEVTKAFQNNIASFIISNIEPPTN